MRIWFCKKREEGGFYRVVYVEGGGGEVFFDAGDELGDGFIGFTDVVGDLGWGKGGGPGYQASDDEELCW